MINLSWQDVIMVLKCLFVVQNSIITIAICIQTTLSKNSSNPEVCSLLESQMKKDLAKDFMFSNLRVNIFIINKILWCSKYIF